MDLVCDQGLTPVDANTLHWRHRAAAAALGPVWTLAQEAHFGDFWAEQIPKLRAEGWSVVVQPGFAHESVPVQRWKLHIAPDTGELLGKEVDGPLGVRERPVQKLMLPEREGAWLLSLGIEIDGETLDLAPMLADLLRRATDRQYEPATTYRGLGFGLKWVPLQSDTGWSAGGRLDWGHTRVRTDATPGR